MNKQNNISFEGYWVYHRKNKDLQPQAWMFLTL